MRYCKECGRVMKAKRSPVYDKMTGEISFYEVDYRCSSWWSRYVGWHVGHYEIQTTEEQNDKE